jgi:hypothetical protein
MIYLSSFIKIVSGIQSHEGGFTNTKMHKQHTDHINLLPFFQNMESELKIAKKTYMQHITNENRKKYKSKAFFKELLSLSMYSPNSLALQILTMALKVTCRRRRRRLPRATMA